MGLLGFYEQMEDFLMARKLTYEQLEQRVKELEREADVLKQAEANIRDSARRYRTILDFVPYPTLSIHIVCKMPTFSIIIL